MNLHEILHSIKDLTSLLIEGDFDALERQNMLGSSSKDEYAFVFND